MPQWSRIPIPTLIQAAHRLYTNAKGDPDILDRLTRFKVPVARLDEGLALLAAVEAAGQTLGAETVDADKATCAAQDATEDVADQFGTDREMARTAYPRGSEAYRSLRLAGRPPKARAAVLDAAKVFYGTLRDRPELIEPIPDLTPEAVPVRFDAAVAAQLADARQAEEGGEVDVASDDRKDYVAALRTHASTTARIAKKALADKPQLREKLGLLARS